MHETCEDNSWQIFFDNAGPDYGCTTKKESPETQGSKSRHKETSLAKPIWVVFFKVLQFRAIFSNSIIPQTYWRTIYWSTGRKVTSRNVHNSQFQVRCILPCKINAITNGHFTYFKYMTELQQMRTTRWWSR